MINPMLHQQPVALDRNLHRGLRLALPVTDWTLAAKANSIFVAATEFGDAAREFPLVFVTAGTDDQGQPEYAPIAVCGLVKDQNLFVEPGGAWRGGYLPALLRVYPFCIGRLDAERFAVCVDNGWKGLGHSGEPLFTEAGEPAPIVAEVRTQLETLDQETQRTRAMCRVLRQHGLFEGARYDATLPGGDKLAVDGFFSISDQRLNALPDEAVLELHKSGALGLVHAHYVSLGNFHRLLRWHAERLQAAANAVPA